MSRTNTANGGTTYADLVIQTVSDDANQTTYRAVIYLTSRNVVDSTNNLSVTGQAQSVGFNIAWSAVDYWGVTLSGTELATVAAKVAAPNPPAVAAKSITATSAVIYTVTAGAENGCTTDAVNYRIHRRSDGAHMGDIQGGYAGVTFTNLSPGIIYDAYGQSHNCAGWGGFSGPYGFTTAAAVPAAPGAGVDTITATTMRAFISTIPGNNGSTITSYTYRVYRTSDNALIQTLSGQFDGVTFTGLTRATAYYVNAAAVNGVGTGPASANVPATTLPSIPGPPGTPVITNITPTSAVASFTAPIDNGGQTVTSYEVQYSLDPTFATGVVSQPTGTLSNLTPGGTYSVRVRAVNASGPGAWSGTATFTTLTGMKFWSGTAWVDAPIFNWSGTAWLADEVRIYNGTAWVPTG